MWANDGSHHLPYAWCWEFMRIDSRYHCEIRQKEFRAFKYIDQNWSHLWLSLLQKIVMEYCDNVIQRLAPCRLNQRSIDRELVVAKEMVRQHTAEERTTRWEGVFRVKRSFIIATSHLFLRRSFSKRCCWLLWMILNLAVALSVPVGV